MGDALWTGLRPAVRKRLADAVGHLTATGQLRRRDIKRMGEVSTQQASADLAEIQRRMPGLMAYDPSAKCYRLANGEPPAVKPRPAKPICATDFGDLADMIRRDPQAALRFQRVLCLGLRIAATALTRGAIENALQTPGSQDVPIVAQRIRYAIETNASEIESAARPSNGES